ncbi:MAG TPA: hypothetical protein VLB44_08700, partial [Kofleriaceae bacterium]|nr:hypothetical protein [Kofleriaceae bacterium]
MRGLATVLVLLVALLAPSRAKADPPKLAGLAPAIVGDARKAIAVGPEGQVYEPDGKGAWVRTQAGGVADELVAVTTANGSVIADGKGTALFKLKGNAWTSVHLALKAKAILGAGSRALAAAGKSIYALDKGRPAKLADAPAPVLALAGGPGGVIVSTPKGLLALKGTTFKPIKNAPRTAGTLVSDRWMLVDRGVVDLKTLKTLAWPAGVRVTDATTLPGDVLLAISVKGNAFELLTVRGAKIDREALPLPDASPVIGLVGDKAGRVVVATRDGHLAVRDKTG